MEDLILMARAAKKRMKGSFWADCKRNIDEHTVEALNSGLSEMRAERGARTAGGRVLSAGEGAAGRGGRGFRRNRQADRQGGL